MFLPVEEHYAVAASRIRGPPTCMRPRPSLSATLLRARNGCGAFSFLSPGAIRPRAPATGSQAFARPPLPPSCRCGEATRSTLDRLLAFCDLVSRVGLPATQGLLGTFGAFCSRYGGQAPFCPLAGHGHGLVPKQPAAGTRTAMPGCLQYTSVTMPTIASRENIRRLLAYRYRVVRIQVAWNVEGEQGCFRMILAAGGG